MEIIRDGAPYTGANGTAVALGYFDGIHLGHQRVLGAMLQEAAAASLTPAVFTFALQAGGNKKGRRLESDAQKHDGLARLGVRLCFEPPFERFFSLSPQQFFDDLLLGQYHARALVCGENFCFGKNRTGDVDTLRTLCKAAGVSLTVVPTTLWQGAPVSSSRIRAALAAGDVEAVNAMLGYPYEIRLPIGHGRGIGRQMGFPTINQRLPGWMQSPAEGVYITQTLVDGRAWPSATGYGTRPTVDGTHATCETFIPGFAGDLYGKELSVRFYKKIADTQRFAGPDALSAAVKGWARQAQEYFAEKTRE